MRYGKNLTAVSALALLVALTFGAGAMAQSPLLPDITVTGFSAPTCVEINESLSSAQITATENNVGTAAVPPPPSVPPGAQPCPPGTNETTCSAIGLYVSADATITTADTLLTGGRTNLRSILGDAVSFGIGASVPVDFGTVIVSPAPVQPPVPTGNVFIGVIGDETQQISESNETNNTTSQPILIVAAGSGGCTGPQPDLVVDSLTHDPANPNTEDNIEFTAVVKNIGAAAAGPSTLSFKIGGESPSTPEALFAVGSLAPGQSETFVRNEVLTVAQNYLNTAVADFNDDIVESDEGNNTTTDSYTVTEANDGTGLVYQVISLPANGTLVGLSGCSISTPCTLPNVMLSYDPDPGFAGTDSFLYQVFDVGTGLTSAAALIDILVANPPGSGPGLTVDFQGSGSGDVALDVGGSIVAICSADCTESLGPGAVVKLQARPVGTATFDSWGGACSSAGSSQIVTITLPASGSSLCEATFNP